MKTNNATTRQRLGSLALTTAFLFLVACIAPRTPPPTETSVPTPTQSFPPTSTPTAAPTAQPSPTAQRTPTTPPRDIVLTAPEEGATIGSPVAVEGRVSVMPFEGTLRGRVYNEAGEVVSEEPIQTLPDDEGELGGPGTFSGSIPFQVDATGPGRVEVAEISARDGSIVTSAVVSVTLTTD